MEEGQEASDSFRSPGRQASDSFRVLATSLGLPIEENGRKVLPPYWSVWVKGGNMISFQAALLRLFITYGSQFERRTPITAQKAMSLMRKAAR